MSKKALGTYSIATICEVAPITIGRWINEGKLPSFRTGGGHRRVWVEDLVKFLNEHGYPISPELMAIVAPKILVIEDEAGMRSMIRRALKKNFPDANVSEAVDGYEAGEKVSALLPSVIILDIFLPGLDGYKVCESIRSKKTLRKVKILAITGHNDENVKSKILEAGADAFLVKPFEVKTLIKQVEKLLGASSRSPHGAPTPEK